MATSDTRSARLDRARQRLVRRRAAPWHRAAGRRARQAGPGRVRVGPRRRARRPDLPLGAPLRAPVDRGARVPRNRVRPAVTADRPLVEDPELRAQLASFAKQAEQGRYVTAALGLVLLVLATVALARTLDGGRRGLGRAAGRGPGAAVADGPLHGGARGNRRDQRRRGGAAGRTGTGGGHGRGVVRPLRPARRHHARRARRARSHPRAGRAARRGWARGDAADRLLLPAAQAGTLDGAVRGARCRRGVAAVAHDPRAPHRPRPRPRRAHLRRAAISRVGRRSWCGCGGPWRRRRRRRAASRRLRPRAARAPSGP